MSVWFSKPLQGYSDCHPCVPPRGQSGSGVVVYPTVQISRSTCLCCVGVDPDMSHSSGNPGVHRQLYKAVFLSFFLSMTTLGLSSSLGLSFSVFKPESGSSLFQEDREMKNAIKLAYPLGIAVSSLRVLYSCTNPSPPPPVQTQNSSGARLWGNREKNKNKEDKKNNRISLLSLRVKSSPSGSWRQNWRSSSGALCVWSWGPLPGFRLHGVQVREYAKRWTKWWTLYRFSGTSILDIFPNLSASFDFSESSNSCSVHSATWQDRVESASSISEELETCWWIFKSYSWRKS